MNQTLVLFLLMAAGFGAGRLKLLDASTGKGISKFLVDFVLPCLVISSMQKPLTPELRSVAFASLLLSFAVYAAAFPLAFLVARLLRAKGREGGVIVFACVFSNCAFMGFPVMEAFFGKESLFTLSIYNIPFQLLAFSLGASIIARGSGKAAGLKLRSFVTPAGLSSIVGFALFLLDISLPAPLTSAAKILGDTTTPLSMALIGSILSRADTKRLLRSPRVYATSLYRLALFPLALFAVLRAFGFSGTRLGLPVVVAAMPVAANASILAEAYGGDAETASALVFVSTLASVVSIPLIAKLLFGL